MFNKYRGQIVATLAVLVVMLIFAFIGAMLDFKNAGGLVVQVPMFFLIVAVWGYVYNAFKPSDAPPSGTVPPPPSVVTGGQADPELRKYLHLSGILNLVLGALLLAALLKVMAMQKALLREERVPGQFTFYGNGKKGYVAIDNVGTALNLGGVLVEQTRREDYEKRRSR